MPIVADTLVTKGLALANMGRAYEGMAEIEGGLHLAERHGLAAIALRARINLGTLLTIDPAAAMDNYRIGLAEARRLGQRRLVVTFVGNAAETAFWTGEWDWASSELDELLSSELERQDRIPLLESLIRIRSWRGEKVDALADDIERLAAEGREPHFLYSAAVSIADRRLALGEVTQAQTAYRNAASLTDLNAPGCYILAARSALLAGDVTVAKSDLAALEATGMHGPWIEARRTSIRAGITALDGNAADALQLYAEAIRRFRDLGLPVDEALTAFEMATVLDSTLPEVRAATDAARQILAGLQATLILDRLEAPIEPGRSAGVVSQN